MNFPTLPTDNFYKFTTISGLILLIFCIWYNDKALREINLLQDAADISVSQNEIALQYAEKRADDLGKREKNIKAEDFYVLQEKMRGEMMGLQTALASSKKNVEIAKRVAERENERNFYIQLLAAAGAANASFGLIFWYWRHQRYQDAILRHEAQKTLTPKPKRDLKHRSSPPNKSKRHLR